MFLTHLSLTNFRTFSRLDMDMPRRILLLEGDNAQGKTSLLEAVYFFSTFTSIQSSNDRQVISFLALEEPLPVCRMVADFSHSGNNHQIEVRLILEQNGSQNGLRFRKEILVDGIKRSAHQAVGLFNAVIFLPYMTRIIEGGPEERRRYLNLALAQVVPGYAKALSEYMQTLNQRNALLKQIAERNTDISQLNYWDDLLAEKGSFIHFSRSKAISEIELLANQIHRTLTNDQEILQFSYQPALLEENDPSNIFETKHNTEQLKKYFLETLKKRQREEIMRGVTTIGPHRDELRFLVNHIDLGNYGSRGQIRTSMLALKLGELEFMKNRTGEKPVLLLDETLAELDHKRREQLLQAISEGDQTILTTTDQKLFSPEFTNQSTIWQIQQGVIIT
ncbi:MAG: DNA replication/repair protein RecF [Chloroflexi bacterium HGW-Chloroflexi-3]|nr:MAG: DNA replication/repair protein RecF [Chloroflexi bacterium HGW-Chloroflexi-3]